MSKQLKHFLLLTSFGMLLLSACTKNPFDKGEVSLNRFQITGQVALSDHIVPEGVFVWLEGYDVSTSTDENGVFVLALPPDLNQGGGIGQSGAFKIYFYVSNYAIKSVDVIIRNGEFVFGKADIDSEGIINQPVLIPKLLAVTTTVSNTHNRNIEPERALKGTPIQIQVRLEALRNNITVRMLSTPIHQISAFFVKTVTSDTSDIRLFQDDNAGSSYLTGMLLHTQTKIVQTIVTLPAEYMEGDYLIFPHLIVDQNGVPADLLRHISDNPLGFSSEYLKLPFKQTPGLLKLRDEIPELNL